LLSWAPTTQAIGWKGLTDCVDSNGKNVLIGFFFLSQPAVFGFRNEVFPFDVLNYVKILG
jgi:hypothetical protein